MKAQIAQRRRIWHTELCNCGIHPLGKGKMEYPMSGEVNPMIVFDLVGRAYENTCDVKNNRGALQIFVEGSIVSQEFTGYKDKDGDDIYAGDILRSEKGKRKLSVVTMLSPKKGWKTRIIGEGEFAWGSVDEKVHKIVGNNYTHPELLKEETNS